MSRLCSDKVLELNKLDDLWNLSRVTEQWDRVDTVWSQWSRQTGPILPKCVIHVLLILPRIHYCHSILTRLFVFAFLFI